MKIFNWVQRRLNPNIVLSKDGQGRSFFKKCEGTITPSPVSNDSHGWKDGILAIGTLGVGCDPLTPFIHHQNQSILHEYEDEHQHHHYHCSQYEQHHEEADQVPCQYLRVTNTNYDDASDGGGGDDDGDGGSDTDNGSEQEDEEVYPLISTTLEHDDYLEWTATNNPAAEDDEMKIIKKRTTLADLFSADSDYGTTQYSMDLKSKDGGQAHGKSNSGKNQASTKTKSMTFAKKLIQPVGENSRPIKKIRGLMKRMMKRKIHPELENKIANESDMIRDANASGFSSNNKKYIGGGGGGEDEFLSLLLPCSDLIM